MENNTEYESAARHLWMDVLREAAKDNHFHGNNTDFAGAFRQFDNFYFWLCLHKYTPGMKVYRYSPAEPFSAINCGLKAEPVSKSLAVQAAELAEYERAANERAANEPSRPGQIRYVRRKFTNADGTCCAIDSETNRRLYSIYEGMRDRCNKKSASCYNVYGGRGIKVCPEWDGNFAAFREWALRHGYAVGLTIERVDPNVGYCPENCRWATMTEQQCNKQRSTYKVLRLNAKDAREWLAGYPDHGIVTIIVRKDIAPKEYPQEVDYET